MSSTSQQPPRQKARTVTASTDRVSLSSRGVPSTQPLLRASAQWTVDAEKPRVNGAPHFVASGGSSTLHLFLGSRGWQIAPNLDADVAYAIAPGVAAAHPNTVRQGEWQLPTEPNGGWAAHPEFHVSTEGPNTEERPFRVEEIGADFFMRIKTTKLVWYVDPTTGEVVHSGAKNAGVRARPGKRYCALCCQCFSANNFVSQHLKNLHTPVAPSPPTVTADGDAGALLQWKVDGCGAGALPCAFAVQYSDDDGHTWQAAIAHTGSTEPRARLAALELGTPYLFRVAAIGLAATGAYSAPSQPFVAVAGAPAADAAAITASSASSAGAASGGGKRATPSEVVARMNASLVALAPEPSVAATAVVAPIAPAAVATQLAALGASARAAEPLASLKRKASFGEGLTPALQDFLDCEIDRVLAETSADALGAELVGDRFEVKLSIPVPKGLDLLPHADAASAAGAPSSAFVEPPPPAKRHAASAEGNTPSPPLTPPLSPPHAQTPFLSSVLVDGAAS